jgi:hypothetical protein
MAYEELIQNILGNNAEIYFNTLQDPWSSSGWNLRLPSLPEDKLLVLHFQDRITATTTGCKELEAIEQHYGDQSNRVAVIFYTHGLDKIYTGPIKLIEFSSHNWLTIHDLLRIRSAWQDQFDLPKTQAWQSLNGKILAHRNRTAAILKDWPNGTLSLGNEIPLDAWDYTTYRGTENYDNFVRLLPLYQRAAVNIVTESEYNARPGVICEKTLYAFVAGQIPIMIAHPGAVQDCRNMGFDMFDDLVDNSFDYLPNDERVEQALLRNKDLIIGNKDLTQYQTRIRYNQEYVMNGFVDWMKQTLINTC